jgi:AcrR family transcriptional regulator
MEAPDPKSRRKKMNVDSFFVKLLELLCRHSPDSLSYSKISRWTGVSRTTIYYYFGSSLEGLMREAVLTGARSFLQIEKSQDYSRFPDYASFQHAVVTESHNLVERAPWAPVLYLRYRHDPGLIGSTVREVEESYFKEQARAYKHFTGREPDLRRMRVTAYLKIGVLYGLQADAALWFGDEQEGERDKLSQLMSELSVQVMRA